MEDILLGSKAGLRRIWQAVLASYKLNNGHINQKVVVLFFGAKSFGM